MKIARILAFTLLALPCFAADQYDGLITLTNLPAQGNTISAAGQTRTWTTNTPTSLQFKTTNSIQASTTNMWLAIANTPWPSNLIASLVSTNSIRLSAQAGASLNISITGGWARVTITTNTSSTAYTYRTPLTAEPSPVFRTNQANRIVADINTYATTQISGTIATGQVSAAAVTASNGNFQSQINTKASSAAVTASNSNFQTQINARALSADVTASNGNFQTQINAKADAASVTSTNGNLQSQIDAKAVAATVASSNSNFQTQINARALAADVTSSNGNFQAQLGAKLTTNAALDKLKVNNGEDLTGVVANSTNATLKIRGIGGTNDTTSTINITGGATVTSNSANVVTIDVAAAGGTAPAVVAIETGAQAIANGAVTPVTFSAETLDSDTMHTTGGSNSRITATTAGLYSYSAYVGLVGSASGTYRVLKMSTNGSSSFVAVQLQAPSAAGNYFSVSGHVYLNVTDYLEVNLQQDTGGNLNTEPSVGAMRFSAAKASN